MRFIFYVIKAKKLMIMAAAAVSIIISGIIGTINAIPAGTDEYKAEVIVIMYHGFLKDKTLQNEYMIDPVYFESDLKYLTENGFHTMFASELSEYVEKCEPVPEKTVILTFDDGYLNNYTYAYPLLKKYSCKAVISPIGKAADDAENEQYRSSAYSQCKWSELEEMRSSGFVELQNHTYNMHTIINGIRGAEQRNNEKKEMYIKRLSSDLLRFNKRMQEETGCVPEALTLPFGAGGEAAVAAAKELGFRMVFDCEEKINYISSTDDLFHIHRFLRPNNKSSEEYFGNILKLQDN